MTAYLIWAWPVSLGFCNNRSSNRIVILSTKHYANMIQWCQIIISLNNIFVIHHETIFAVYCDNNTKRKPYLWHQKNYSCIWQPVFITRHSVFFFSHDNRSFEINNRLKDILSASSFRNSRRWIDREALPFSLIFCSIFQPGQQTLEWHISNADHEEDSTRITAKLRWQSETLSPV